MKDLFEKIEEYETIFRRKDPTTGLPVEFYGDDDEEYHDVLLYDKMTEFILNMDPTKLDDIDKENFYQILDMLDIQDPLNPEDLEGMEYDDYDEYELEEGLNEKRLKKVIRKGKVVKKVICKKGYKASGGRCVRMTSTEKRIRQKAAKKAARKSKSKKAARARHQKLSNRKRKSLSLK